MTLTREEIAQLAEASALEVINKLHRYPVTYHRPKTIQEGLQESMGEELTASNWYRERAKDARSRGDEKTALLYEDIAGDEDDHYREFNGRLDEILA